MYTELWEGGEGCRHSTGESLPPGCKNITEQACDYILVSDNFFPQDRPFLIHQWKKSSIVRFCSLLYAAKFFNGIKNKKSSI